MEKKEGWLLKWTNYMKGYRKRWFVLENGVLTYYSNEQASLSDCRGTIVVHQVLLEVETGNNFMVSVQDNVRTKRSIHLRAKNTAERAEWIYALEHAKNSAATSFADDVAPPFAGVGPSSASSMLLESASEGELSDEDGDGEMVTEDFLKSKLGTMRKHQGQLSTRCSTLQTQMQIGAKEVPGVVELQSDADVVKQSAAELLLVCTDYLTHVESHKKDWLGLLETYDRKRHRLEGELEALAAEHQKLEQNAASSPHPSTPARPRHRASSGDGAATSGESDDEFYDAEEELEMRRLSMGSRKSNSSPATTPRKAGGVGVFERRTKIPKRPEASLSLWSLLKSCIGKDLTRIAMPVNLNEPLSFVQRLCEDLEYSHLLDSAVQCETALERMVYVAVFTASAFASGANNRTGKPFNPLLAETYELDRRVESGWRCVVEQVSHHPPICCMHCESDNGWTYWQECAFSIKFRGKYIEVTPTGVAHLKFARTGDHYTWTKVPTAVHNIVVGNPWVDQHGTMTISNHANGDKCTMQYLPYSIFAASDQARRVIGKCVDKDGKLAYSIDGNWDKTLFYSPAAAATGAEAIWSAHGQVALEGMYGMTPYAITLNELSPVDQGCCPTDARLRPDVRMMEAGNFKEANTIKVKLEEGQRARRKEMEQNRVSYSPRWFEQQDDPLVPSGQLHKFKGGYWEAKLSRDWGDLTKIYL